MCATEYEMCPKDDTLHAYIDHKQKIVIFTIPRGPRNVKCTQRNRVCHCPSSKIRAAIDFLGQNT